MSCTSCTHMQHVIYNKIVGTQTIIMTSTPLPTQHTCTCTYTKQVHIVLYEHNNYNWYLFFYSRPAYAILKRNAMPLTELYQTASI